MLGIEMGRPRILTDEERIENCRATCARYREAHRERIRARQRLWEHTTRGSKRRRLALALLKDQDAARRGSDGLDGLVVDEGLVGEAAA
jgi:hypothetical protein